MKQRSVKHIFAITGILMIGSAYANDQSEHASKMEKQNCEYMNNMDHSKMNTNDPVMMDMMRKCMGKQNDKTGQDEHVSNDNEQQKMRHSMEHSKTHHDH